MASRLHCNHEFTCPAFLFANEIWSIAKREQESQNGTEQHPFAVSTIIHTKKESRGKSSRHGRTHDDLLSAMNAAFANNGNTTTYVEAASKFMQFDQQFMSFSASVDKLAVEKVNRAKETPIAVNGSLPNLDFFSSVYQCRSETVRHYWDRISTILSCVDTHTRNAAEYHSFFTDCNELGTCMSTHGLHLLRVFDRERIKAPIKQSDIDAIYKTTTDMATSFRYYQQRISELRNRAYSTVCPIQYRTKPILSDCRLPARCLIDADFDVIMLRKKQELFILDNADQAAWKVRTMDGDIIEIPAIFVEIPAPCDDAIEYYGKLVIQMADIWSEVVKAVADYLIWLTYALFTNVGEFDRVSLNAAPQVAKSKLLQFLIRVRSTFGDTWKEFEAVDKVEKLITDLANKIEENEAAEAPAEKSPILAHVDRLTSAVNAFDTFLTSWKRFVTASQICRLPEAFLVADRLEFKSDIAVPDVLVAREQEELIKSKWRVKLEARSKSWNDAKARLPDTLPRETQTEVVRTQNEEVEAIILNETADAQVGCTTVSDTSASQTDPEPVPDRGEHEAQTEKVAMVNQEVDANLAKPSIDKMVDCSAPTSASSVQTVKTELNVTLNLSSERIDTVLVESTDSEEEQHFVITGVVDIAADLIISLDEAIQRKIIDQMGGTFKDTQTNELMPIPEAMNIGNIVTEMKSVSRKEQKTSYGMITVVEKKEKKWCKINFVLNAKTNEKLVPKEAIKIGLLDPNKDWVLDTRSNTRVSLTDAITQKLVEVEQRLTKPEVSEVRRKYDVRSVTDRKAGSVLNYDEAIRSGVLHPESGEFLDTLTGQKIRFSEALNLNYIDAKVSN